MFSRASIATLMLTLVTSILLPASHAAKIYHWVDDDGQAHYSENPPREIKSDTLNVQAAGTGSAGSASISSKPSTNSSEKKVNEDKAEKSVIIEHSAADKAKYCQQSRDLLQQMQGNMQRRFEQPDGSFRKLEQAEIADYQAQAKTGIDSYCK